ncbi:putative entry exclusion protein TrbK-alt [Phenylobacterium sp.]|uniref:putative entry exclusion protein TrbK-alt n=2 Tax=Caulobacterales TaxID=204458 RepID=UPI004035E1F3
MRLFRPFAIGMKPPRPGRALLVLGLGVVVVALLLWLSAKATGDAGPSVQPGPSGKADPLRADLLRCNELGAAALDEATCKEAWAENRRRFLGAPETR